MYVSLSLSPCMYVTNYEFSIPIKWHLTYFMIFRGLPNVIILVAPQFQSFWPRSLPMVFAGSFARSGNRFSLAQPRPILSHGRGFRPISFSTQAFYKICSFWISGKFGEYGMFNSTSLIYSKYIPKKWWMIRTKPYTTTISRPIDGPKSYISAHQETMLPWSADWVSSAWCYTWMMNAYEHLHAKKTV